jgi:4-hydroxy-2-oxoheptanedioate aldolase
MLRTNYLKEKLNNNKLTLGTWNIINSTMVIDVIASCGIDFIVIDAEHGSINYETAQTMVSVCESYNVTPIMRVGEINESLILRALDIGVHGIQIPNVETREDAKKIIEYSKYPPIGIRGFTPYSKAGLYDVNNGKKMTKIANENTLIILNIEGQSAFENLEEIVQLEGVDVIFIGLFDLSKSLGIPGEVENPIVMQKLDEAIDIVHKYGKKIGSIASNIEMLKRLKSKKIDYLTYSVDTGMIKESYTSVIESFRGENK